MLFCHRGTKAPTPPSPRRTAQDFATSQLQNASPLRDRDLEEWRLPSILTAGSLDELSASNPLLPEAPVMPAALEAQLATLSNGERGEREDGKTARTAHYPNRRSHQLLISASMHSLVSSSTVQDCSRNNPSKKSSTTLSSYVDGNLSLPITHKRHHNSGLSLLSLSHHRSSSSTLRKLRPLDVNQFSSLLDFEERFNDPWVGSISLRRTAKPNLENERHRENSLFLSILEAKGLHSKKKRQDYYLNKILVPELLNIQRYYCDVCLDRTLYARTTSKQCPGNSIFWAEEFDLNNLPDVSILTVSLYREAEGGTRDIRKGLLLRSNSKKALKKPHNRLIGFVTLPIKNVSTRNPAQTWLTLQSPNVESVTPTILNPSEIVGSGCGANDNASTTFVPTASPGSTTGSTGIQLRVSVRYKSVDILPISDYLSLHTLVRENGIEFAQWFEHLIPLKLKEEVASCLVNLHERGGTAVSFLTELVVREVSSLENESMTFRSNTMATKAVESYIKLVGKEYLHNLLYRYIQRILVCPETWEVDPCKLSPSGLSSGTLMSPDGQGTAASATLIIRDYCAKKRMPNNSCEHPKVDNGLSRLAVFNNGRVAHPGSLVFNQTQLLQHLDLVWDAVRASVPDFPKPLLEVFASFRVVLEPTKGAEFCDKLISACIFLRFICPAILTPSLFGLASSFPGELSCQRNLTLIAKSLQSLANLSTFGDKESFMRFMNAYVETQIPVMRNFLRNISSLSAVFERSHQATSPMAKEIDCGYELACLQNICHEILNSSTGQETCSATSSMFGPSNEQTLITPLPPSLARLPEIITHLENVKSGSAVGTDAADTRAAMDSEYAAVDSGDRLPSYSTLSTVKSGSRNPPPLLYLSMQESMADSPSGTSFGNSKRENHVLSSPIQKPRAVRPVIVKTSEASSSDVGNSRQILAFSDTSMASPKKVFSIDGDYDDDQVTVKELLKGSAFLSDSVKSCERSGGEAFSSNVDADYDDPYNEEICDSAQPSRRQTINDAVHGDYQKNDEVQTSNLGASPVRTIQIPSPPSAFSLYRRPLATASTLCSIPLAEVAPIEGGANLVTVSFTTPGVITLPRRSHCRKSAIPCDRLETSSTITNNAPSENLVLEPQPNPIVTRLNPCVSLSSTTSPGRLSLTNKSESRKKQYQNTYCQATSINLSTHASDLTNIPGPDVAARGTLSERMLPSFTKNALLQMDYDVGNVSVPPTRARTGDSYSMTAGGNWTVEPATGVDWTSALPARKVCGPRSIRSHPSHTQPVSMENEELLTSTLEELGDAVAWLERERDDLLSMQESRQSNKRPRSRLGHISGCESLPQAGKLSTPTIHTCTTSAIGLTTSTAATTTRRLNPHTSTPSLYWLNFAPSPNDEIFSLTKSTNSLTEQPLLLHKHHRSAVSKTFTLSRSGSASVSPSRRSRDGSDSANNTGCLQLPHQRTTTLVLASKMLPESIGCTRMNLSGPQTPVGLRRRLSKEDNSDEFEVILQHPYHTRSRTSSFVSTSNCNLLMSNNPPHATTSATTTATTVIGGDTHFHSGMERGEYFSC